MRVMKKILVFLTFALALAAGCTKQPSFANGENIGQIYLTAASGAKTVLVKLPGFWKVSTPDQWISLDVNGRGSEGAFTMYYGSNESDMVSANATRQGTVIIEDLTRMVADTLHIVQQGTPDGTEYGSTPQDSYIEFRDSQLTRINTVYANMQGCTQVDRACNWIDNCDADVICLIWEEPYVAELLLRYESQACAYRNLVIVDRTSMGGEVSHTDSPVSLTREVDGICICVSDFGLQNPAGSRYAQIHNLLESGYNMPHRSPRWIIGGSFYYYSVMEVGYDNTPAWYPSYPLDALFDADRYAQSNNLTDCVWMCNRRFNPTYEDERGSWRPDYVYASNSVWNAAVTVKIGQTPDPGYTSHNTLGLTVKY